jgi:hypothetical protein
MALAGIGATLNQGGATDVTELLREHFERPFTDAMARDNTLLQRFTRRTGSNVVGLGAKWKIHYAGNTSAGSYSELDEAPAAVAQSIVEAYIPYRQNWITYGVSGLTDAATRGAGGWEKALAYEASESLEDLKNEINGQMLAFSKAAATDLDGIGVIVSDTGTYATIDRTTYTWFKSYVAANGGTDRALAISLMQDQLAELEKPARKAKISAIMSSRKHYNDYGNLLQAVRRYVNTMKLDGGIEVLEYESIPVIPVLGMSNGSMFFLDEKEFFYDVLENFKTTPLPVNGDAVKYMTVHYSALLCKHTGRQGRIDDLA